MGILDMLNAKKIRDENEQLKKLMTPEMQNAINLNNYINELNSEIENLKKQSNNLSKDIDNKNKNLNTITSEINTLTAQLFDTRDALFLQDFNFYKPKYALCNSEAYKERLSIIRNEQKQMIKLGTATTGNTNWTVNGSKAQGNKMVKDMQKLLLRAFNSECDELIDKVKYNNIESAKKRIEYSVDAISRLGKTMSVAISYNYYQSKLQELYLAYEYQMKKQEEKEEQRAAREALREAAKLEKEIEEERRKALKEQNHYQNALKNLMQQINSSNEVSSDLLNKKAELESKLDNIEQSIKSLDYRQSNQRAGYVYVISNIGAFGENVYKIGMTRRLNPQDRVDELGDASVPFRFDVHAMIFSDDAPALEAALHKAFEDKKVNMVNQRREFFKVTLDEIKDVVRKNFDKTVEFIEYPDAEQYRESELIRKQLQKSKLLN